MSSNPYAVPAIVSCAVMLIGIILGLCWVTARKDRQPAYRPEHTHRAVRARLRAEAAHPFADPADVTDPDGEQFVGQITHEPDGSCGAGEADWWDQQPPPPLVEVLTGQHARIAQTSALTINVLARVRDGLRNLAADEDRPDDTLHDLHAVATWGKTAPELADELAAKYLAAPQ